MSSDITFLKIIFENSLKAILNNEISKIGLINFRKFNKRKSLKDAKNIIFNFSLEYFLNYEFENNGLKDYKIFIPSILYSINNILDDKKIDVKSFLLNQLKIVIQNISGNNNGGLSYYILNSKNKILGGGCSIYIEERFSIDYLFYGINIGIHTGNYLFQKNNLNIHENGINIGIHGNFKNVFDASFNVKWGTKYRYFKPELNSDGTTKIGRSKEINTGKFDSSIFFMNKSLTLNLFSYKTKVKSEFWIYNEDLSPFLTRSYNLEKDLYDNDKIYEKIKDLTNTNNILLKLIVQCIPTELDKKENVFKLIPTDIDKKKYFNYFHKNIKDKKEFGTSINPSYNLDISRNGDIINIECKNENTVIEFTDLIQRIISKKKGIINRTHSNLVENFNSSDKRNSKNIFYQNGNFKMQIGADGKPLIIILNDGIEQSVYAQYSYQENFVDFENKKAGIQNINGYFSIGEKDNIEVFIINEEIDSFEGKYDSIDKKIKKNDIKNGENKKKSVTTIFSTDNYHLNSRNINNEDTKANFNKISNTKRELLINQNISCNMWNDIKNFLPSLKNYIIEFDTKEIIKNNKVYYLGNYKTESLDLNYSINNGILNINLNTQGNIIEYEDYLNERSIINNNKYIQNNNIKTSDKALYTISTDIGIIEIYTENNELYGLLKNDNQGVCITENKKIGNVILNNKNVEVTNIDQNIFNGKLKKNEIPLKKDDFESILSQKKVNIKYLRNKDGSSFQTEKREIKKSFFKKIGYFLFGSDDKTNNIISNLEESSSSDINFNIKSIESIDNKILEKNHGSYTDVDSNFNFNIPSLKNILLNGNDSNVIINYVEFKKIYDIIDTIKDDVIYYEVGEKREININNIEYLKYDIELNLFSNKLMNFNIDGKNIVVYGKFNNKINIKLSTQIAKSGEKKNILNFIKSNGLFGITNFNNVEVYVIFEYGTSTIGDTDNKLDLNKALPEDLINLNIKNNIHQTKQNSYSLTYSSKNDETPIEKDVNINGKKYNLVSVIINGNDANLRNKVQNQYKIENKKFFKNFNKIFNNKRNKKILDNLNKKEKEYLKNFLDDIEKFNFDDLQECLPIFNNFNTNIKKIYKNNIGVINKLTVLTNETIIMEEILINVMDKYNDIIDKINYLKFTYKKENIGFLTNNIIYLSKMSDINSNENLDSFYTDVKSNNLNSIEKNIDELAPHFSIFLNSCGRELAYLLIQNKINRRSIMESISKSTINYFSNLSKNIMINNKFNIVSTSLLSNFSYIGLNLLNSKYIFERFEIGIIIENHKNINFDIKIGNRTIYNIKKNNLKKIIELNNEIIELEDDNFLIHDIVKVYKNVCDNLVDYGISAIYFLANDIAYYLNENNSYYINNIVIYSLQIIDIQFSDNNSIIKYDKYEQSISGVLINVITDFIVPYITNNVFKLLMVWLGLTTENLVLKGLFTLFIGSSNYLVLIGVCWTVSKSINNFSYVYNRLYEYMYDQKKEIIKEINKTIDEIKLIPNKYKLQYEDDIIEISKKFKKILFYVHPDKNLGNKEIDNIFTKFSNLKEKFENLNKIKSNLYENRSNEEKIISDYFSIILKYFNEIINKSDKNDIFLKKKHKNYIEGVSWYSKEFMDFIFDGEANFNMLNFKNGNNYKGKVKKGNNLNPILNGKGVLKRELEDSYLIYDGFFENDYYNGKGVLRKINKENENIYMKKEGIFKKDILIEGYTEIKNENNNSKFKLKYTQLKEENGNIIISDYNEYYCFYKIIDEKVIFEKRGYVKKDYKIKDDLEDNLKNVKIIKGKISFIKNNETILKNGTFDDDEELHGNNCILIKKYDRHKIIYKGKFENGKFSDKKGNIEIKFENKLISIEGEFNNFQGEKIILNYYLIKENIKYRYINFKGLLKYNDNLIFPYHYVTGEMIKFIKERNENTTKHIYKTNNNGYFINNIIDDNINGNLIWEFENRVIKYTFEGYFKKYTSNNNNEVIIEDNANNILINIGERNKIINVRNGKDKLNFKDRKLEIKFNGIYLNNSKIKGIEKTYNQESNEKIIRSGCFLNEKMNKECEEYRYNLETNKLIIGLNGYYDNGNFIKGKIEINNNFKTIYELDNIRDLEIKKYNNRYDLKNIDYLVFFNGKGEMERYSEDYIELFNGEFDKTLEYPSFKSGVKINKYSRFKKEILEGKFKNIDNTSVLDGDNCKKLIYLNDELECKYIGKFENNFIKKGTKIYLENNKMISYDGDFKDNNYDSKNGLLQIIDIKKNEIIKSYEGIFEKDKFTKGIIKDKELSLYKKGVYNSDGEMNDWGVLLVTIDDLIINYVGYFKVNNFNGFGILKKEDIKKSIYEKYTGLFNNNECISGKIKIKNKDFELEGTFQLNNFDSRINLIKKYENKNEKIFGYSLNNINDKNIIINDLYGKYKLIENKNEVYEYYGFIKNNIPDGIGLINEFNGNKKRLVFFRNGKEIFDIKNILLIIVDMIIFMYKYYVEENIYKKNKIDLKEKK